MTELKSAPKSQALDAEERKKRFKELRERMGRPRTQIDNGDPSKHYFWAAKDDTYEMSRLEYLGYAVVKVSSEPKDFNASGKQQDGTFILGDTILMQCPHDIYDYIMLDQEERANSLVLNAKENFRMEAEKQGAPTFEVDARTGKMVGSPVQGR